MSDLTEVINESLEDSTLPAEPVETPEETPVEAAPETVESSSTTTESREATAIAAVTDPAKPEPDEFEKKFGIPAQSATGRENRIPYSRVKKIIEKREKDLEASYTPKITEYETKVKDYEGRLEKVAQFEKFLREKPQEFIEMLRGLPQYQSVLSPQAPAVETKPAEVPDDMPQPDSQMPDGTLVYSMEGLKALNQWNRVQARKEVMEEVQKVYGPIQQEWQAQQQLQQMVPVIQGQIAEARKWEKFNENEADIVKALQADSRLSLEGAYRQVVVPKLTTDRDKLRQEMRQDILRELKKAPASTSAPATATKPSARPAGPRSITDIINESIEHLPQ